jgi:hypothetical protein
MNVTIPVTDSSYITRVVVNMTCANSTEAKTITYILKPNETRGICVSA